MRRKAVFRSALRFECGTEALRHGRDVRNIADPESIGRHGHTRAFDETGGRWDLG